MKRIYLNILQIKNINITTEKNPLNIKVLIQFVKNSFSNGCCPGTQWIPDKNTCVGMLIFISLEDF